MYAIIATGGKQYKVTEGQTLRVEKLGLKDGEAASFDKVLLYVDGEKVTVGTPYIDGAVISADHVREGRLKKVTTIKYKQKSRYFKKRGHKQHFSEVKVAAIKAK